MTRLQCLLERLRAGEVVRLLHVTDAELYCLRDVLILAMPDEDERAFTLDEAGVRAALVAAGEDLSVLPFLGVDSEECGPNAAGEFVHLPDSPADGLADPIDVQAQPIPEGLGILYPITTLGNHPCLIVQPLHDAATLPLSEVSQDPVPMGIEGRKERVQLLVLFLQKRPIGRQLLGRVVLVAGLIKDFRHPPAEPVDKLQRRNLREQRFQAPPLLVLQVFRTGAEGPHLTAERLPLRARQLLLVGTGLFLRTSSTTSPSFLAT